VPWCGQATCTFWPWRAEFGLGRATLASEKKKKSCSEFSQILHGGL
jgi:hypothetical protein